ncbi:isoprenoid biosynthesis glyoxalase ElbB [Shewanella schlegeliana]|uniref:Glyoxalase n=1 Tax=Shewanella schlegeliana TaxID=190308 RepID=A0ABS1T382_9GAMM|nr:isoprenoid biosynthesis glyoxalase ElbB [Shewanella schlegeliana]MBL4915252.1 isoprenoid biosynthesis glyoxalase ElbB [Shewanella schlegeliana]MCL1111237.1 isoprenoid biosynthesis glyoxalase ElbB [Shewanella schlegeliana]GIU34074.1 glyoxalase [Shewanella schlegeliana]
MKKIAVLLSGSGVYDGSEIHESVLALLEITRAGASYQCFAPNIPQFHVVNHLTGEVQESETRNVLVESARIARGDIKAVDELEIAEFDALVIPGGFGAAKNLCDFAIAGAEHVVEPSVKQFILQFSTARKPVGFICISPVMIPQLYPLGISGTIGSDAGTAAAFELQGGQHKAALVDEIVVDEEHKVVSTPAYMLAGDILEAHSGISKLVAKVLEMA